MVDYLIYWEVRTDSFCLTLILILSFLIAHIYLFVILPVIEELKATGKFELMDIRVDEAEHSMEMHLPYLAKVFEG